MIYLLNLPFSRLIAHSQRVGDAGLGCFGSNGDVAFLFRATCSTGATALGGSSTRAVGGRDERPVDGGRGSVSAGAKAVVAPFPAVLAVAA